MWVYGICLARHVMLIVCGTFVFFFKQKTAYEMRISDWSSDVCSSDLVPIAAVRPNPRQPRAHFDQESLAGLTASIAEIGVLQPVLVREIGRASCRARVCQYV